MRHLYLPLAFIASTSFTSAGEMPRVLFDFSTEEQVKLVAAKAGGITCEHHDGALKASFQKGQQYPAIVLEGEVLKDWNNVEALALDLSTENAADAELLLDLSDERSSNFATRCTLPAVKLSKGKQTLTWKLSQLKRNSQEHIAWETVLPEDRLDLATLKTVRLFAMPPADAEWIVTIDNVRLIPKSAEALAAEKQAAEKAAAPEQVVYTADFEKNEGLGGEGVPFKRNWLPLDKNVQAEYAAPMGTGNESKRALSVKCAAKANYVCMELPLHGTIVEPEGWDGFVSLKLYNAGYDSFQMTYAPLIPTDVTWYRVHFDAPKNQWTQIDIPLDNFKYYNRRPRRGCPLEYLCLIGVGPSGDGAAFQFDDVKVYRKRRENMPPRKAKPPLPAGVSYRQNFDDANDFDLEGFYPWTRNCNIFRVDGGLDETGQPLTEEKDPEKAKLHGLMNIICYEPRQEFSAGRHAGFDGAGIQIVFDVRLTGVTDFAVLARNGAGRWRQYPKVEPGKWTRVTVSAEEFAKFGTAPKDGVEKKLSRGERFTMLYFGGYADGKGESKIEIDNLVIRKAE